MNLKANGQMAKYYKNFYNTEVLPKNLCNFFWLYTIALMCYFFCWPTFVLKKKYPINLKNMPTVFGFIIQLYFLIVGHFVTKFLPFLIFKQLGLLNIPILVIIGCLFLISFLFILIKTIIYIYKIIKFLPKIDFKFKSKRSNISNNIKKKTFSFFHLLKHRIIDLKNNYCPIITWEE
jgi:hypothetical protein